MVFEQGPAAEGGYAGHGGVRRPALCAVLCAAACALVIAFAAAAGAAPAPAVCPAVDEADLDSAPLAHLSAVLKPNAALNVLAVGSSAQQADAPPQGAATPASGPWQMARALEARVHGLHVTVTVRTARDLQAADMAAIIRKELAHGHYQLVLWQTGTLDAVRDASPGEFYQALSAAAGDVSSAGADLVLVDPQFSRFLEANANVQPYLAAMQAVADLPGAVLFDRYQIMRGWADAGAIDLERTPIADRAAASDRLHMCLGRALAHMLLEDAARSPVE